MDQHVERDRHGRAAFLSTYTEEYASKVDAQGTLKVALRHLHGAARATILTRTVGVRRDVTRDVAFVAQCFGPVAALTSQTDADAG